MDVLDMDAPYALPAGYQPPALPKLTIPTLVVWAMEDIALPAANLDGLDEVIADLTLMQVPGCGHFVQWEAPGEVNAALDAFLARTDHG
jgi:pimeloyl-ACP methyl ester carboxylesterase